MPDDPMTIRYPVRRIVRTTPKIVARGRMESRSVGMKFVEPPLGTYFGIGGNDGPYGVDRRWIVAGGWAGRATYAVGKIQQTGAETAFFHMGLNTYAGGYRVVLDGNGHEKTLNPGSAGNELPQYPAGWGPELKGGLPFPFHWSYLCRTRAGFDTTEPYFASITDAGAEKACWAAVKAALDANAQAHGRSAGKLILYFGAQHVDDWDNAAAFETLPEALRDNIVGEMLYEVYREARPHCMVLDASSGTTTSSAQYRTAQQIKAAGIRAGVELWPSAADGVGNPHPEWEHWAADPNVDGFMRAEWWPKWGPLRDKSFFMPLEQVKGDLYLLGSSVSAGGFVGGSMIYNPGSGDGGYADYIAARNAQITECSKYGVGMILMDSDWTHSGLKAAGVII